MSKRSRHGNDFAPSTFPFLAVLLCVIGALVLLLVINVTNSRASAKKLVEDELSEAIEQAKEQSDFLVSISEELQARREQVKKQIESRRRELARTEDHIRRLEEQLESSLTRLESLQDPELLVADREAKQEQIKRLQDQIQQEKQKLSESLRSRKDQTPAFSIIPYEGANRTTRRPVYLECTSEGVVIQPEGILIRIEDLGPPHGPGNPLDAALRVLRTAYQARDAVYGITIPPYPLLIVRPEGIHSYALARSAMSGWDDQFRYELIDERMQMAYPKGIPELASELTKTLEVAKDRQRALVAALPARFSRNPFADTAEDTWDSIDAQSTTGNNAANKKVGPKNASSVDDSQNGRRWEMIQQVPTSSTGLADSFSDGNPNSSSPSMNQGSPSVGTPPGAYGSLASVQAEETQGGLQATGSNAGSSVNSQPMGNRSLDYLGQGTADGLTQGGSAVDESGVGSRGIDSQGSQSQGNLSGANSGQSSSSSKFSGESSGSSGGSSSLDQSPQDAQLEQAIKEQALKDSASGASGGASTAKQKVPGKVVPPRSGMSAGELKPISLTAGKDWATSRMDNKSTPVSRPIRIIVLQDRWLMCREGQDWKYDAEILLEQGPQTASAATARGDPRAS